MKENTVLWCSLQPVFAPTSGKMKWLEDDPGKYGREEGQLECHVRLPAGDSVCTILPLVLNYKCRAAGILFMACWRLTSKPGALFS